MALNFPNSPTDGQIYYDASSGNRYIYDSANTIWKYSSNAVSSVLIANTSNTQVLYNYEGSIAGSNALIFSANTLSFETANISNVAMVGGIDFNIVDTWPTVATGQARWNLDEQTLDIGLANGSILQSGQEVLYYVKNQSGALIPDGTVVRAAGTLGSSGRILIAPFTANGQFESKYCIGVTTTDIVDGGEGYVAHFGKIRGINTTAYAQGAILYANATSPGAFATTLPTAPNNKITLAIVIHSDVNGILFVRPTFGSRINENELAEVTSLANGDLLVYNSTRNRFENNPQSAINAGNVNGFTATTLLTSANNAANSANAYTVTVGAASNNYANASFYTIANGAIAFTAANGSYINANNSANSANAYTVTVGAAANTFATSQDNNVRAFANSTANSANAYTVTVGAASNTYANVTFYTAANGAIAFTQANGAYINANNAANSSNAYTVTVGAASNNYANASFTTIANGTAAFAAANGAYINANNAANSANAYTVTVGAASNNYANASFYTIANGSAAFAQANGAYINANNAANSANAVASATYYAKSGGTISGDVAVTGNLTVSGQTTYSNTNTLLVGDNIITLNADIPGNVVPIENAGIEVNRGSRNSNAQILWIESANAWGFTSNSQNVITTYIASNTDVVNAGTGANSYSMVYANGVANSANAYAVTVGAAANTWANTKLTNATATFAGTLTISGDLVVTGNANLDFGTVVVDAVNSKVGIAQTTPSFVLDVGGDINMNDGQSLRWGGGGSTRIAASNSAGVIGFYTSGVEKVRLDSSGQLGIGTTGPAATLDVVGSVSTSKANVLSQTLTFVASPSTIAWNTANGQIATLTLTGNGILAAPTNLRVGTYILHVIQDGVGGRTLDVSNAVFKWPGGVDPVATSTLNARDVYTFVSDGTNLYGSYIQNVK